MTAGIRYGKNYSWCLGFAGGLLSALLVISGHCLASSTQSLCLAILWLLGSRPHWNLLGCKPPLLSIISEYLSTLSWFQILVETAETLACHRHCTGSSFTRSGSYAGPDHHFEVVWWSVRLLWPINTRHVFLVTTVSCSSCVFPWQSLTKLSGPLFLRMLTYSGGLTLVIWLPPKGSTFQIHYMAGWGGGEDFHCEFEVNIKFCSAVKTQRSALICSSVIS